MTEIGPVSYECPRKRRGVLHVIGSSYIAEVIDPHSGPAVAPGEHRRVGADESRRTGSPLLRYRTGDLVQPAPAERCECGSYNLALEGGILGRTDDMVVVRGVNIYPSAVEDILRGCEEVAEYRVEIRTGRALPELSIQVEPAPDCRTRRVCMKRLEAACSNALACASRSAASRPGYLPRFEMKAKRWVRL